MTSLTGWKKICVAVDFSEESRAALLTAAELARASGGALTMVHVRVNVPLAAADVIEPLASESEDVATEEVATLAGWRVAAEQHAGGAAIETRLLSARSAADEIVRFARAEGFDLLVIGTHGRTGLRRLVLGSVAEHVLRHAECPVLVVRPPHAQETTPIHAAR